MAGCCLFETISTIRAWRWGGGHDLKNMLLSGG